MMINIDNDKVYDEIVELFEGYFWDMDIPEDMKHDAINHILKTGDFDTDLLFEFYDEQGKAHNPSKEKVELQCGTLSQDESVKAKAKFYEFEYEFKSRKLKIEHINASLLYKVAKEVNKQNEFIFNELINQKNEQIEQLHNIGLSMGMTVVYCQMEINLIQSSVLYKWFGINKHKVSELNNKIEEFTDKVEEIKDKKRKLNNELEKLETKQIFDNNISSLLTDIQYQLEESELDEQTSTKEDS